MDSLQLAPVVVDVDSFQEAREKRNGTERWKQNEQQQRMDPRHKKKKETGFERRERLTNCVPVFFLQLSMAQT